MFSKDSSGDAIADRRYTLAEMLYERGDVEAALDLLQQAEELAPHWPPLPFRRGEILMGLARNNEAAEAFKACLHLDPEDRLGAEVKLTLLGALPQPETLPASYVEALFDDYAPRFETALVETLEYRVPEYIAAMVERHAPREEQSADYILDLGCGTGLSGDVFVKRAAWIEGIDLSAGMLDIAAAKGVYNQLRQGDILTLLQQDKDAPACDLAIAADVLVYMGEVGPLFKAVSTRMRPGGLFAFSVQKLCGAALPYQLCDDHRYAHSASYLEHCLAEAGLSILECEEKILRQDRGAGIDGYIIAARKPYIVEDITVAEITAMSAGRRRRRTT